MDYNEGRTIMKETYTIKDSLKKYVTLYNNTLLR